MSSQPSSPRRAASNSILHALEKALARLDGSVALLARGGALAGVMMMTAAPAVSGCTADATSGDDEDPGESADAIIGNGQTDWAQQQGQRDTAMVSYVGDTWWSYNYSTCSSRFCPTYIDVFVKLRVKPVQGVDLNWKKVGVVYRTTGTSDLKTVNAYYFTTWGNGDEEWHVKMTVPASQNILSFNAWYQDGASHTYYDDNNGELHVATAGYTTTAIARLGGESFTNVVVDDGGVHGTISARVADIDWDKQIAMVYTTDGWQSSSWMNLGAGANEWHWAEDYGADYERWAIDVDLPGDFQSFQYAILYRHGVANSAKTYDFWDNNGGANYVVERQPDPPQ
jgi:hypothetical protein